MKINISHSFLALAAALALSTSAAHAQTLVDTDFTSATPTGSGLNDWSTGSTYGHLAFGSGGAVSTGHVSSTDNGYYTTTADFSSTIGLSSTPTWLAVTMSLGSYSGTSTATSFNLNLGLTGDTTGFTFGSKPLNGTTSVPDVASPDWLTGFEDNNYGGMFGGGTATPAGPTTYLLEISSDGSTVSGSVWAYNTPLPSTPPTDGTGAANYGTFSFASAATGLSDVNLSGQGLAGTYSSLVIAGDYADVVSPGAVETPEPTTLGYLACGALGIAGLAVRRRFCRA